MGLNNKVHPLYTGPYKSYGIKRIDDYQVRNEHVDRLKLEMSLTIGQALNIDIFHRI